MDYYSRLLLEVATKLAQEPLTPPKIMVHRERQAHIQETIDKVVRSLLFSQQRKLATITRSE